MKRKLTINTLFILLLLASATLPAQEKSSNSELTATADLNGDGVENNDGGNGRKFTFLPAENTVEFYPDRERSDQEQPLYFYIKISGYDPTEDLTVKVMWYLRKADKSTWAPRYARWSYDRQTWHNTQPKNEVFIDGKGIPHYVIPAEELTGDPVFLSHGYTRTYNQWITYIDSLRSGYPQYLEVQELCRSNEKDLSVKLLKITDGEVPDAGKKAVWIISRQHSFEVQNDVVMKGMIDYMLGSTGEKATYLRENAIVYIVPLMDADGAHVGTPGKMNDPPDFNRVWNQHPAAWNAVEAVRDSAAATALRNKVEIFFDFHNPYPEQNRLEILHRFAQGEGVAMNDFRRFFKNHQADRKGYQVNQVGSGSTSTVTAGGWAHYTLHPSIAGTFEIGWDKDEYGNRFNYDGYISAGESFAFAISRSIKDLSEPDPPPPPPEDHPMVTFRVTDRSTGEPVNRPLITWNGNTFPLSEEGLITKTMEEGTEVVYTLSHDDYFPHTDSFTVTGDTLVAVALTGRTANLVFEIEDRSETEGTVFIEVARQTLYPGPGGKATFYDLPAREWTFYSIEKEGAENLYDSLYLELDTTLYVTLQPETTGYPGDPGADNFRVYPNPASGTLTVDQLRTGQGTLSLYNAAGKKVFSTPVNQSSKKIDLSALPGGIYTLTLVTGKTKVIRKFVIN